MRRLRCLFRGLSLTLWTDLSRSRGRSFLHNTSSCLLIVVKKCVGVCIHESYVRLSLSILSNHLLQFTAEPSGGLLCPCVRFTARSRCQVCTGLFLRPSQGQSYKRGYMMVSVPLSSQLLRLCNPSLIFPTSPTHLLFFSSPFYSPVSAASNGRTQSHNAVLPCASL